MKNINYNYSSTARKIDIKAAIQEAPSHQTLRELEGNKTKEKKRRISFLYVLFLAGAMVISAITLINYIRLQSDINASVKRISNYEQQLNDLTLANDDEYSKMVNTVDLEEIKRIAIEELGMVYPDSTQVVTYTRENSDYVRQLAEIGN